MILSIKRHLSLGTLQTQITLLKHPQGPFDNTALTFIQVLNLHRGLAVINLKYGLFSLACSYDDENYHQNLKQPVFHTLKSFVILCSTHGTISLFLSFTVSSLFSNCWIFLVSYECQSFQFRTAEFLLAVCSLSDFRQVPWLLLCAKHHCMHLVLCGYKAPTITYTKLTS